ncbi:MAG: hypothetical protein PHQ76_06370 [Caldisericia bacterium]|nr:hypothetical protein [Caldisericia bacterium]
MNLIDRRTGLYTIKSLIATEIYEKLIEQKELLEAITEKTEYQQYYYDVLSGYFFEDDEGEEVLNFFIDKYNSLDPGQIPAINLIVDGDENSQNGSPENAQVEVSFEVEVFDDADGESESDSVATAKVEFMSGIIRFILENMTIPGIQHKRVQRRKFIYRNNNGEASNITYSGVVFFVKYVEKTLIASTGNKIKTNLTDFSGRFQLKTDNLEV